MKKLIALVISLILTSSLYAAGCEVESISVNWTAFQTPEKVGVNGSFDTINFEAKQEKDDCAFSFFTMATVHIDTKTVNTQNKERDTVLVKSFFKHMIDGEYIDAIIKRVDLDKEELSVEITMNDVSQSIYMPYTFDEKTLKAKGKIDLLNFLASPALSAINDASSEQGKGKTWSDIEVSFDLVLKNKCQ